MGVVSDTIIGTVWIRDFDLAVVKKLDAFESGGRYYCTIPGVDPPTYPPKWEDSSLVGQPMPGIPVVFAAGSDRVMFQVLPMVMVRREDYSLSLERWPSLYLSYRAPAAGANPVQVDWDGETLHGWDRYEVRPGPYPYDLSYTVSVMTTGPGAESVAQTMAKYMMQRFKPRNDYVEVVDSLGDTRRYEMSAEGPSSLREVVDVMERVSGFALSVMVLGELDQDEPILQKPVLSGKIRGHIKA